VRSLILNSTFITTATNVLMEAGTYAWNAIERAKAVPTGLDLVPLLGLGGRGLSLLDTYLRELSNRIH
jgi:hypothetical protein